MTDRPEAGSAADGADGAESPGGVTSSEQRLIEAAQRDPSRFAELYDANFHRIYAFVVRRVPVRADAQDIVSEVFQKALTRLSRFEWRGVPFAAWLYRIAANAVTDHLQRASRERSLPVLEVSIAPEDPEPAERRARLYRMVAELPADQRRVMQLRFAGEKSIRETAEALGRSEGAIKQLQFRALQALRQRMGESDG